MAMAAKVKFSLEFPMRCSAHILYEFIATPNGLSEWFADNVNQKDKDFYFHWNGSDEKAVMLDKKDDDHIKFKLDSMDAGEFFEFKIVKADVTNGVVLIITDFATPQDIEDQSALWESQVNELKHRIGS
jgi:START-like superfamily domain